MSAALTQCRNQDAAGAEVHEGEPRARAGRAGVPAVGRGVRAGARRPHPQVEAAHAQLRRLQDAGRMLLLTLFVAANLSLVFLIKAFEIMSTVLI